MSDLTHLTIGDIRKGLAGKAFSATELTQAYLGAMGTARGLNAYIVETPEKAQQQYAGRLETAIARCCAAFSPATINVFIGHMLVSGAAVAQGGGERKLHIGDNFAVQSSAFPASAQYVALGHIHKMQQMAAAAPAWYAGSLLQLDFGEAGQDKFVNLVDIRPRQPAEINPVQITGGRGLRTLQLKLADLPEHADRYGDDYLRVTVQLDGDSEAASPPWRRARTSRSLTRMSASSRPNSSCVSSSSSRRISAARSCSLRAVSSFSSVSTATASLSRTNRKPPISRESRMNISNAEC